MQDGYRLVLLSRLAFFALWDGTGETYVVPRAAAPCPEAALPGGSYVSGQGLPAEAATSSAAARDNVLQRSPERACPEHTDHPVSPAGTPDPAQQDDIYAHHVAGGGDSQARAEGLDWRDPAQADSRQTPASGLGKLDQDGLIHVESDDSEPDDSFSEACEASGASAESAESVEPSNCDPHAPDDAPGVVAPDLAAVMAAHDFTQVVSDDINAPLVTIALDEAALAPAILLLRLPYLERLLEAPRTSLSYTGTDTCMAA